MTARAQIQHHARYCAYGMGGHVSEPLKVINRTGIHFDHLDISIDGKFLSVPIETLVEYNLIEYIEEPYEPISWIGETMWFAEPPDGKA